MRSPALAIAWEFGQPHRWTLAGLAGYLLVVGLIKLLVVGPGQVSLDPPNVVAAVGVVPVSVTFMYLLAVFSFGFAGDLAARQSIYPARMFTLPVATAALAGWPMLYGTAAMACLWLSTALLARWPWGIDVPLVWPALLAAAFLAWTQALTWVPYGLPGVRVIVTVLWLMALDAVVILAVHYEASGAFMVAFLAPQLPLAYLAAYLAVARARRGDVPDWRGVFGRPIASVLPRQGDHRPSPAGAQLWFEWRQHGWSLPALVGMLLPFELALLFIPGNGTPAVVFTILVCALFTPTFMAGFVAATVSKANPHVRDSHGVPPFMATRPLTSAALVAAKLTMAIWSTMIAWMLVLASIPLALIFSGTWPVVIERAAQGVEAVGTVRAIVIVLLGLSGLVVSTWSQLVQNLYIGLTGRAWLIKSSVFLTLSFLIVLVPAARWVMDNDGAQEALWDAVPWIPAVLVGLKMPGAAWVAMRLVRSRLVSDRALVGGAACWCGAVLALYASLAWLFSAPQIPRYWLALVAILMVPLVRVSAAPLALAWNRHR